MTVYAPSNFSSVIVPADDRGGCGQPHVRDVGPDQAWALTCECCEPHLLATDSRWVKDINDIPPTYDEARATERWRVQGAREQDAMMTSLLAQLAGYSPSQIPQSVQRAIGGIRPHIPLPGQMVCRACEASQPAGQPYCGECGAKMSAPSPGGPA